MDKAKIFWELGLSLLTFSSMIFAIVTSFEALNGFRIKNLLHWQRRAFPNMQNTHACPLWETTLARLYWNLPVPQEALMYASLPRPDWTEECYIERVCSRFGWNRRSHLVSTSIITVKVANWPRTIWKMSVL